MYNDIFLQNKLDQRVSDNALRRLLLREGWTDFCSNDYLGLARRTVSPPEPLKHGSGGARTLAGNHPRMEELETMLAEFHQAEAALVFNSGYTANLGLMSAVPQRGDSILYDYLAHASLRDGIRLSLADAHSFAHNDLDDLEKKLARAKGRIFVVTESVFSMDGHRAPLREMLELCEKYGAHLVVDEAHATGVTGPRGAGLVQEEGLQERIFARVHTFGKALGAHGAAVLGSERLKSYLINFSRAFIFTTALPETSVEAIRSAYQSFPGMEAERRKLGELIQQFQSASLPFTKLASDTPIQGVLIPGNEAVKQVASILNKEKLDVRPILYPTVPKGMERLRISLHAFNDPADLQRLLRHLALTEKQGWRTDIQLS